MDQIKATAEKYVAQMLDAAKPEKVRTDNRRQLCSWTMQFAVVYKARNNDKIKRADVITAVASILHGVQTW